MLAVPQGFKPPLPAPALAAMLSYIEGDVFRGSRRMPLHDALQVITEEMLETVPGLLRGHVVTLRIALRNAKQVPPVKPAMTLPSTAMTPTAPPTEQAPVLLPAGPASESVRFKFVELLSSGLLNNLHLPVTVGDMLWSCCSR